MSWQDIRENIVGDTLFKDGAPLLYADWTASGRLYAPIEDFMRDKVGPWVANTHTESSDTGRAMTGLYQDARQVIKQHVNASDTDVLVLTGAGMTGAVNKLQRMMGIAGSEAAVEGPLPLVLITHMEHHSNQTTWLTRQVDVEIIQPDAQGLPCLTHLATLLNENRHRPRIIASVTACSNVTGIETPYHQIAQMVHAVGGFVCVDFAASAPYVAIDMHPETVGAHLDAVMFSPHKFLGGPGSSGVLVFNPALYRIDQPDQPGGGTVRWTNPWGEHQFYDDIEMREDGGTPGFLQAIRAALAIQVKEGWGVDAIHQREQWLGGRMFDGLIALSGLQLLAPQHRRRLPIFSFYIPGLHHELVVQLLNDKFGIQCRGGCSCAGTYGHILLGVSPEDSHAITDEINSGDLSRKPGWVRVSLHPTMTEVDVDYLLSAIEAVIASGDTWQSDYVFDSKIGSWHRRQADTWQRPSLADFQSLESP
jgi:selenocysteine lyase/cysteine desulfurase